MNNQEIFRLNANFVRRATNLNCGKISKKLIKLELGRSPRSRKEKALTDSTRRNIHRILAAKGGRKHVSIDDVGKIAKVLEVPPEKLAFMKHHEFVDWYVSTNKKQIKNKAILWEQKLKEKGQQ